MDSIDQDLFKYFELCECAKKELKLDDENFARVIFSNLSQKLKSKVKDLKTYEEYKIKLLKSKYRQNHIPVLERHLFRTTQSKFQYIAEYKSRIDEITKRIAIAEKMTDEETKKLRKKAFKRGLHEKTAITMSVNGIHKTKDMVKVIKKAEKIISEHRVTKQFSDLRLN